MWCIQIASLAGAFQRTTPIIQLPEAEPLDGFSTISIWWQGVVG